MSIILSEHFSDFFGETEHFSGKNGALRWSILVGKQKYNVQKPRASVILAGKRGSRRQCSASFSESVVVAGTSYQM